MSDRHELQAAGTHPAPCARHCEATAFEIEMRHLRRAIAESQLREAMLREALRRLLESDKDGAIASASNDDLIAAISDESASDVVRIQAAAILSARAALAYGERS